MSISAATRIGGGAVAQPSRQDLIYTAHQQLEDALDTLRAYVTAAQKHNSKTETADGGFSPWTGVKESAEKCGEKACRCLRLFAPARKMDHLRGMTSLSHLYGTTASTAPSTRLRAFLDAVSEGFGGVLPFDTAITGGRCLHRLDPAAADDFLVAYVQSLLTPPPPAGGEAAADAVLFHERYCGCVGLDRSSPAFALQLRSVLLIQIEAAAQAGHTAHTLAALEESNVAVAETLPAALYAELLRYEAVCWREAARLQEARNEVRGLPTTSGSPAAVASPPAQQQQQQPAGARETQRAGGCATPPTNSASGSGWRWQAVRIAVLILLAVLVRFASGPLSRALKAVLQVAHPVQTRRRTLTL